MLYDWFREVYRLKTSYISMNNWIENKNINDRYQKTLMQSCFIYSLTKVIILTFILKTEQSYLYDTTYFCSQSYLTILDGIKGIFLI